MIEVLTGVFCGVLSGLIAGAFGYVKSKGTRFDTWILIVAAVFGVFWVQLGGEYFTWQEWFLTVVVVALFEYGGKAIWRKYGVDVKIDRERFFVYALNVATAVYIVLFLVALFLWFLPFINSAKFAVYELNWEDELVFRLFASSVAQGEIDAFFAYLIFGFPLMAVFSYYALTSVKSGEKGNK